MAERIYFCNRLDIKARHEVKKGEKRSLMEQKLQLLHEVFTASTDELKKVGIQEYKSLCEKSQGDNDGFQCSVTVAETNELGKENQKLETRSFD